MNTDDVIAYRDTLAHFDLGGIDLPQPIVYATEEWVATIHAMAHQIPIVDDGLTWPSHAEIGWSWAESGLLVVFEVPVLMQHIIITDHGKPIPPEVEQAITESMVFSSERPHARMVRQDRDGEEHLESPVDHPISGSVNATTVAYLSPPQLQPNGLQTMPMSHAYVPQGYEVHASPDLGFSQSTRFLYAMFWALGHPMTAHTPMPFKGRPAMRRWQRTKLPPIRMLTLAAPPAETTDGERPVDWTKSWKVRTHWRNQACGPKMRQHKRILVHEYWKQTHLPPDTRPTVWRAD